MQVKECNQCGSQNSISNKYCNCCSQSLINATIIEILPEQSSLYQNRHEDIQVNQKSDIYPLICPECGATIEKKTFYCPECRMILTKEHAGLEIASRGGELFEKASLIERGFANFLDHICELIIIFILVGLILVPIYGFGINNEIWYIINPWIDHLLIFLVFLLSLIMDWIYNAWFESSKFRATPGKMLLGLCVIDCNGGQITRGQATQRYILKRLTYIIFSPLFFIAIFTDNAQTIHDMLSGTLVVGKVNSNKASYLA